MDDMNKDMTYEKLEAFLAELAETQLKTVPLERSCSYETKRSIEIAKRAIQQHREQITALQRKILAWETQLSGLS